MRHNLIRCIDRISVSQATLWVQINQSGTNFLVALVFASLLGSEDFGKYAILQVIALFFVGVADSAAFVPLLVRISKGQEHRRILFIKAHANTVALILVVLAVSAGLLVASLTLLSSSVGSDTYGLAWAIFGWTAALCLREWQRQNCIILRRLGKLIAYESLNSIVLLVCLGVLYLQSGATRRDLEPFIWVSASVGLLPMLVLLGELRSVMGRRIFLKRLYKMSGWSLAGAQITWVQSQTYLLFVASMLDSAAAGVVAASRLVFQPIQTAVVGFARGILADLAVKNADARAARSLVVLKRFVVTLAVGLFLWTLVALMLSTYFDDLLESKGYEFGASLLIAWAAVVYFNTNRSLLSQVLRAYGDFRAIAYQGMVGACASLLAIPIGIVLFGSGGAVGGLAIAEISALCYGYWRAKRYLSGGKESHDQQGQ